MKEVISREKDAHKAMCWNSSEENKGRYESEESIFKCNWREG